MATAAHLAARRGPSAAPAVPSPLRSPPGSAASSPSTPPLALKQPVSSPSSTPPAFSKKAQPVKPPFASSSSSSSMAAAKEMHRILSSPDLKRTDSVDKLLISENTHEPVRRSLTEKPRLQRWDSADFYSMPSEMRSLLVEQAKDVFNTGLDSLRNPPRSLSRRSSGLSQFSADVQPFDANSLNMPNHHPWVAVPFTTGLPSPTSATSTVRDSRLPRYASPRTSSASQQQMRHKRWDSGEFYSIPEDMRALAPTQSKQDLLETMRISELNHEFQPRHSGLSIASFSPSSPVKNVNASVAASAERPRRSSLLSTSHNRWDSGEYFSMNEEGRRHARTQSHEEFEEAIRQSQERAAAQADGSERRPRQSSLSTASFTSLPNPPPRAPPSS